MALGYCRPVSENELPVAMVYCLWPSSNSFVGFGTPGLSCLFRPLFTWVFAPASWVCCCIPRGLRLLFEIASYCFWLSLQAMSHPSSAWDSRLKATPRARLTAAECCLTSLFVGAVSHFFIGGSQVSITTERALAVRSRTLIGVGLSALAGTCPWFAVLGAEILFRSVCLVSASIKPET